jgi:hypothetical protein
MFRSWSSEMSKWSGTMSLFKAAPPRLEVERLLHLLDAGNNQTLGTHARHAGIQKPWQSIPRVADAVQDEGFPGDAAKRGALRLNDLHVASERRDPAELVFRYGDAHLAARSDEDVHREASLVYTVYAYS